MILNNIESNCKSGPLQGIKLAYSKQIAFEHTEDSFLNFQGEE